MKMMRGRTCLVEPEGEGDMERLLGSVVRISRFECHWDHDVLVKVVQIPRQSSARWTANRPRADGCQLVGVIALRRTAASRRAREQPQTRETGFTHAQSRTCPMLRPSEKEIRLSCGWKREKSARAKQEGVGGSSSPAKEGVPSSQPTLARWVCFPSPPFQDRRQVLTVLCEEHEHMHEIICDHVELLFCCWCLSVEGEWGADPTEEGPPRLELARRQTGIRQH